MRSSTQDLQTYWPFLPTLNLTPAVQAIVDARIHHRVPARAIPTVDANGEWLRVTLDAIEGDRALVRISYPLYGWADEVESLPVYLAGESITSSGGGYLVVSDKDIARTYGNDGMIAQFNPMCIDVLQELPTIRVSESTGSFSLLEASASGAGTPEPVTGGTFGLAGGVNVSVTYEDGALSIVGEDTPEGKYPPFREIDENTTISGGRGLRCVNGHTGDVTLASGSEDVVLDVSLDGDVVRVTIGANK